jgi:hypothetical protein
MSFYAIACTEATKSSFYYITVSVGSGGSGNTGSSSATNHGKDGGGTSIGFGTPSGSLGTWGTVGGGKGGTAGGDGGGIGG